MWPHLYSVQKDRSKACRWCCFQVLQWYWCGCKRCCWGQFLLVRFISSFDGTVIKKVVEICQYTWNRCRKCGDDKIQWQYGVTFGSTESGFRIQNPVLRTRRNSINIQVQVRDSKLCPYLQSRVFLVPPSANIYGGCPFIVKHVCRNSCRDIHLWLYPKKVKSSFSCTYIFP